MGLHISAYGPRARRLTAKLGAGWLNFVGDVPGGVAAMQEMRQSWDDAGRAAADLTSVAFALAAADTVGVNLDEAASAIESVLDVDGRYAPFDVDGRRARIIMLKNPAGWTEAIDTALRSDLPMVIYAQPFGPRDTTTIWEVEWERLSDRNVVVSGQRAPDVVACLDVVGLDVAQTARALDMTAVAVRVAHHRGLRKLRTHAVPEEPEPDQPSASSSASR